MLRLLTCRLLAIPLNQVTIIRHLDEFARSSTIKNSGCQMQRTKSWDNISLHLALQKLQALSMRNCIIFQPEIAIIDSNS